MRHGLDWTQGRRLSLHAEFTNDGEHIDDRIGPHNTPFLQFAEHYIIAKLDQLIKDGRSESNALRN